MDATSAEERVIALLLAEVPMLHAIGLKADTALLSSGLLDSFAIVTLIASLDAAFAIDIDVETIELEAFETPAKIAALCLATRRRGG